MDRPRRIAVTFFLASLACLVAMGCGVAYMAAKQNELARSNQITMAQGGILQMAKTLKTFATDYGYWDDLYVRIPSADEAWFESNVATAVTTSKVVDFLVILDKERKPFRGWIAGGSETSDVSFIDQGFLRQFDRLFHDDPKGTADPRYAVMVLGGAHYLVAAGNVVTTSPELPYDKDRQPKILTGHRLSGERIEHLAATYLLKDLVYTPGVSTGLAVLSGVDGKPIGSLNWVPDKPGTSILKRALIPISTVALMVLGVGAFFAWRANRIASEMALRERQAQQAAETALHALARKGKLEQLGQLTATVAHEIRNPLGSIRNSAFLLERRIKGASLGLEPMVERITAGVARCDNIITQLLDFSRNQPVQAKQEDLDTWLEVLVTEESAQLPASVNVQLELGLAGEKISFDGSRLSRVLINLISNASEAMVGNGKQPLKSSSMPTIWIRTRRAKRGFEIEVEDNGPGISTENLQKILEPLFTTKSFGTGLGLPAAENIMRQHGGGLEVMNEDGKGARFVAWLPAIPVELAKVA